MNSKSKCQRGEKRVLGIGEDVEEDEIQHNEVDLDESQCPLEGGVDEEEEDCGENGEDQQYIQLQQEYLTVKSKLSYAENEYNRQKELNQSKASSDKVFQQTEVDYKTQRISLSALAEKLRLININPKNIYMLWAEVPVDY